MAKGTALCEAKVAGRDRAGKVLKWVERESLEMKKILAAVICAAAICQISPASAQYYGQTSSYYGPAQPPCTITISRQLAPAAPW
jgi:hypothetical protein